MARWIRQANEAPPLPTVPTVEAWRAMTPEARERFVLEVNAALKAPAELMVESLEAEAAQAQAKADQVQAKADQAVEGLREALLAFLDMRGLSFPDEARARIHACDDPSTLRRWLALAKTATSAGEVVS